MKHMRFFRKKGAFEKNPPQQSAYVTASVPELEPETSGSRTQWVKGRLQTIRWRLIRGPTGPPVWMEPGEQRNWLEFQARSAERVRRCLAKTTGPCNVI